MHPHEALGNVDAVNHAVALVEIAGVGNAKAAIGVGEPVPLRRELSQVRQSRPVSDGIAGSSFRFRRGHLEALFPFDARPNTLCKCRSTLSTASQ
jgi:hypothetical protein